MSQSNASSTVFYPGISKDLISFVYSQETGCCFTNVRRSTSRLAQKSSSKSAKRDRAPCQEARSAIVGARASESSTCFPCWKSNQVTLFWRELFRLRSCLKGLKLSKLLFASLIMGSKPRLFCADQPRLFPSCFTNSRKYMYLLILNVMGL